FRSKLDDFYKLLFFFVSSSYIFKTDFLLLFTIHFCLALTKIHDTATAASLSLAKKKEKKQSYNQKRDHCRQYLYPHSSGIFVDELQDTLSVIEKDTPSMWVTVLTTMIPFLILGVSFSMTFKTLCSLAVSVISAIISGLSGT